MSIDSKHFSSNNSHISQKQIISNYQIWVEKIAVGFLVNNRMFYIEGYFCRFTCCFYLKRMHKYSAFLISTDVKCSKKLKHLRKQRAYCCMQFRILKELSASTNIGFFGNYGSLVHFIFQNEWVDGPAFLMTN